MPQRLAGVTGPRQQRISLNQTLTLAALPVRPTVQHRGAGRLGERCFGIAGGEVGVTGIRGSANGGRGRVRRQTPKTTWTRKRQPRMVQEGGNASLLSFGPSRFVSRAKPPRPPAACLRRPCGLSRRQRKSSAAQPSIQKRVND